MSDDIRPGDVLLGKLRVVRLLGEGATGRVFEVLHTLTGHRRALKVMRDELSTSSAAVARFVREAGVASKVESPHVAHVYDAGRLDGGAVYMLMELADGRTLRVLLDEHGRLEPTFAVELAAEVAEGLAAVHAAGLVHRDIKPENLVVQTDAKGRPRAKILDFGLLRPTTGHDAFGSLTPDGDAPGTLRYMAPEAERGDADGRTDVYALGVVLYEMLAGVPPYDGPTAAAVLLAAHRASPTPLVEVRPDVDEALDAIVRRAIAADPGSRTSSAAALAAELRGYLVARRRSESVLSASPLLSSRYEVIGRIGEGGMGTVYEVVHRDTRRRRALKLMHPRLLADAGARARFRSEAIVAADVDSDHIVEVLDAGVCPDTDTPFLVMELMRGEDLSARLSRGPMAPAEVASIVDQLAMALDRAHARGVVHRDLKPANVFLAQRDDGSMHVKILDFGIAKMVSAGETAGGVGTPAYMAPEQMEAGRTVGPPADLHALAHVAYAALTGASYWRDEASQGLATVVACVARGPVEPASRRAGRAGVELPAAFDAWFASATSVDPASRPATAGEAAAALRASLGLAAGARARTQSRAPTAASAPGVAVAVSATASPDGATEAAVTRERVHARGRDRAPRVAYGVAAAAVVAAVYFAVRTPERAAVPPAPVTASAPPVASGAPSTSVDPPGAASAVPAVAIPSASAAATAAASAAAPAAVVPDAPARGKKPQGAAAHPAPAPATRAAPTPRRDDGELY